MWPGPWIRKKMEFVTGSLRNQGQDCGCGYLYLGLVGDKAAFRVE
jgi:hypothetical protein